MKIKNLEKIIENINIPVCKNCIYYKTNIWNNNFTSMLNECNKFGTKNIITDEIKYDYADYCRNNELKCGKEGKYFEKEKYIKLKILKYNLLKPNTLLITMPIFYLFYNFFI